MYAQHWGLVDIPFQSTIDQRWFYEGPSHEEAVARLLFIVEQHRRLGVLVGEAGTGKSMLLAVLKRAVQRAQGQVINVNVAGRSGDEVVWELAAGLRHSPRPDDPPVGGTSARGRGGSVEQAGTGRASRTGLRALNLTGHRTDEFRARRGHPAAVWKYRPPRIEVTAAEPDPARTTANASSFACWVFNSFAPRSVRTGVRGTMFDR